MTVPGDRRRTVARYRRMIVPGAGSVNSSSRQACGTPAVQDHRALDAPSRTASMQVSTFGIMPPEIVPSAIAASASATVSSCDQLLLLVQHAGDVGQHQQPRRLERAGDGARHGVGVDVVGLARRRRRRPARSPG